MTQGQEPDLLSVAHPISGHSSAAHAAAHEAAAKGLELSLEHISPVAKQKVSLTSGAWITLLGILIAPGLAFVGWTYKISDTQTRQGEQQVWMAKAIDTQNAALEKIGGAVEKMSELTVRIDQRASEVEKRLDRLDDRIDRHAAVRAAAEGVGRGDEGGS